MPFHEVAPVVSITSPVQMGRIYAFFVIACVQSMFLDTSWGAFEGPKNKSIGSPRFAGEPETWITAFPYVSI
jgi:hypothetical protein